MKNSALIKLGLLLFLGVLLLAPFTFLKPKTKVETINKKSNKIIARMCK